MAYIATVEDSHIDVTNIRDILVQGSSAHPVIQFVLDPSLTGYTWSIRGTYIGSGIAVTSGALAKTESVGSILVDWTVSADFTTYPGEMQLALVGANGTGTEITKALGTVNVQRDWSIGSMGAITLDLFEQLMARATETISHYPYIGEDGNWFVWDVSSGAFVDTGENANGAPSYWYTGTTITGTSATPTAFPSSGITEARFGDMYLNESTSNVYRCTLAGNAATALWSYRTSIKGADGADGTDGVDGTNGTNGTNGVDGADGADGERGSLTFSGSVITGTSTTPTAYATGITLAIINDRYRNTDSGSASYQNEYVCTLGGNAATALWSYDGNVRGVAGVNGTDGTDGTDGADGVGIPAGGSIRQVIVKASVTDYDTAWANAVIQYASMPTADASNVGQIAQFTGTTGTYTHGHIYESVSSGGGSPTYSWTEIVYGDPNSVSYSAQTGKTDAEKAQARSNIDAQSSSGWVGANETWTYVSVDDPTGIFKVNADVTAKCCAGQRIKMTNGGNVIFGIITVVSTYGGVQAGYTHITFLHEIDPSDNLALYLMANSAITLNYYSSAKAPFGFPLDLTKWSIIKSDSGTIREQALATHNVWYELYTGLRPSVPIGLWIPKYVVKCQVNLSAAGPNTVLVTLSTSSATQSSALNTASINGSTSSTGCSQYFEKELLPISLTSKATFYLNTKGQLGSGTMSIFNRADDLATVIRFTCAYL